MQSRPRSVKRQTWRRPGWRWPGLLLGLSLLWALAVGAEPAPVCVLDKAATPDDCPAVAVLLAASPAPPGVVFDVIEDDAAALSQLLPVIERFSLALRERHPRMTVVLLSHGNESLRLGRPDDPLRAAVAGLAERESLTVTVCATYAGWRGLSRRDFDGYIDVADSADRALADYQRRGYRIIRLRPETALMPLAPWHSP